jgi:hypothetical protein
VSTPSLSAASRALFLGSSLPAARSVLERRIRERLTPETQQRVVDLLLNFESYMVGETREQLRGASPADIEVRAQTLAHESLATWRGIWDTTATLLAKTGIDDDELTEQFKQIVGQAANEPTIWLPGLEPEESVFVRALANLILIGLEDPDAPSFTFALLSGVLRGEHDDIANVDEICLVFGLAQTGAVLGESPETAEDYELLRAVLQSLWKLFVDVAPTGSVYCAMLRVAHVDAMRSVEVNKPLRAPELLGIPGLPPLTINRSAALEPNSTDPAVGNAIAQSLEFLQEQGVAVVRVTLRGRWDYDLNAPLEGFTADFENTAPFSQKLSLQEQLVDYLDSRDALPPNMMLNLL